MCIVHTPASKRFFLYNDINDYGEKLFGGNRCAAVRMFGGCAIYYHRSLKRSQGKSRFSCDAVSCVYYEMVLVSLFTKSQQYKITQGALMGDGRLLESIQYLLLFIINTFMNTKYDNLPCSLSNLTMLQLNVQPLFIAIFRLTKTLN